VPLFHLLRLLLVLLLQLLRLTFAGTLLRGTLMVFLLLLLQFQVLFRLLGIELLLLPFILLVELGVACIGSSGLRMRWQVFGVNRVGGRFGNRTSCSASARTVRALISGRVKGSACPLGRYN